MAKSIATQLYANALRDTKDRVVRARNSVAILTTQRKAIGRLLRTLSMCVDTNSRSNSLHMWMSGDEPVFSINLYHLDGFKSLRLESVLWLLEEIGTLDEQKEYASCLNRDFTYIVDGYRVLLSAYVKDDSPTCRKIVIGTETVTTPKYAIQCD
jgi:hypothetical protein